MDRVPIRASAAAARGWGRRFLVATGAAVLTVPLGCGHAVAAGSVMVAVKTLPAVITSATQWVVGILFTLAGFFFTVAGLRYMAAGGDPAQVEKAKGSFKSAVSGLALALLAPVFVDIVKRILGA